MSKNFNVFRRMVLGYILIIGLAIGLITPIVQAEAPTGSLYSSSISDQLVDGLTQAQRAAKIDAFYISRDNSPLAGYGLAMVQAADTYGIDWKLLPAISIIESSGGKQACKYADGSLKYNAFGWGGCKIAFESYEQAIDTITKNLAGHNPKTAHHYKGKTISQIIDKYNPPSVRHDYNKLVMWAMNKIDSTEIPTSVVAVK